MGREHINILTTLNILFLDMEDELPSDAFTDAMCAEVFRLTEDDELAQAKIDSNTILDTLNRLFVDEEDLEPSIAFTYAMLGELARLVGILSSDEAEPPAGVMRAYLTLGDEYMALRHFKLAREYYQKTLAFFSQCPQDVFEDEELAEMFGEGCVNLLKIYGETEQNTAADDVFRLVRNALPERYEEIHKRVTRKPSILYDPVEYTDKYLAVLPELEVKIETELKDIRRSMGFCFRYWHTKAEILRNDYGIKWDSPAILNPHVRFD